MIGFCDHGNLGLTYLIYYRFQLKNGTFAVSLVWARGKVGSVKAIVVPRGECAALWLGTRAMNRLAKLSKLKFQKYILFTDSATVLSMLKIPSVFLDTYYGGKIREMMESGEDKIAIHYKHVLGSQNPADLGTKSEIVSFSKTISEFYQKGNFLTLPEEQWPEYCGDFKEVQAINLPGLQKKYKSLLSQDPYLLDKHSRDEDRLEKGENEKVETAENTRLEEEAPVTSNRLIAWKDAVKKFKSFEGKYPGEPFASLLVRRRNLDQSLRVLSRIRGLCHAQEDLDLRMRKIERLLVRQAMLGTKYHLRKMKIHLESTWDEEEGLLLLVSRDLGASGPRETIILSAKTAVGLAVLVRAHDQNHLRSVNHINNKLKENYHIPQARKYLVAIGRRCFVCRRLRSEFIQRPLGRVHADRLGEDYRGPFSVCQAAIAGNWVSFDPRV